MKKKTVAKVSLLIMLAMMSTNESVSSEAGDGRLQQQYTKQLNTTQANFKALMDANKKEDLLAAVEKFEFDLQEMIAYRFSDEINLTANSCALCENLIEIGNAVVDQRKDFWESMREHTLEIAKQVQQDGEILIQGKVNGEDFWNSIKVVLLLSDSIIGEIGASSIKGVGANSASYLDLMATMQSINKKMKRYQREDPFTKTEALTALSGLQLLKQSISSNQCLFKANRQLGATFCFMEDIIKHIVKAPLQDSQHAIWTYMTGTNSEINESSPVRIQSKADGDTDEESESSLSAFEELGEAEKV